MTSITKTTSYERLSEDETLIKLLSKKFNNEELNSEEKIFLSLLMNKKMKTFNNNNDIKMQKDLSINNDENSSIINSQTDEEDYEELKAPAISISRASIEISKEYFKEGKELNYCIFKSYHLNWIIQ